MSGSTTWNPPASPTVGELYQFAGATWSWNGSAWVNANTGEYFVTPGAMASAIAAAPQVPQNYVDNSGFTINQRGYATGAALAAGAYGFDRWKGGPASGGTLTFTASPASAIVTVSAGSIQQVVEGLNMLSQSYTLSWSGTATGRIATTSGGGSYAASPVQFTATADTNTFIEFTGGTLGQVQLQLGSVATPWQPQPFAAELLRCHRFYFANQTSFTVAYYAGNANGGNFTTLPYPTQMRALPTINMGTFSSNTNAAAGAPGPQALNWFQFQVVSQGAGAVGLTVAGYTASADL